MATFAMERGELGAIFMSDQHELSALTRSLVLGVSVGAIALTQIGCQPLEPQPVRAEAQGPVTVTGLPEGEARLCSQALESRAAADVDAVLVQYPRSRCVGPLLGAMPAATLAALSPAAVRGVPEITIRQLPASVLLELPSVPSVQQAVGALGSSEGGGGGRGGGGY